MSLAERLAAAKAEWAPDARTTLCDVSLSGGGLSGVADKRLEPDLYAFAGLETVPLRVAFLSPERRYVLPERAFLLARPALDAETVTEARHNEALSFYDRQGDFCRVATARDGYLGWLPLTALGHQPPQPTHCLSALRAHLYAAPNVNAPRRAALSFGTGLAVLGEREAWAEVRYGRDRAFVSAGQLSALSGPLLEAVGETVGETVGEAVAEFALRFVETPYLWGGVTAWGLDCSGLVQTVYSAFGFALPRDSDQQERCGVAVDPNACGAGDLLFFPGHVALALGDGRFVHANAQHMRVTVDDFESPYGQRLASRLSGARRVLPEHL